MDNSNVNIMSFCNFVYSHILLGLSFPFKRKKKLFNFMNYYVLMGHHNTNLMQLE
jgi:hypothetical protein